MLKKLKLSNTEDNRRGGSPLRFNRGRHGHVGVVWMHKGEQGNVRGSLSVGVI